MKITRPLIASLALVAAMSAGSAWAWPRLGPAPIVVHWTLDGRPNGFASPAVALMVAPLFALALAAIMAALPRLSPPRGDLERSARPYAVAWFAVTALLAGVHAAILAKALGAPVEPLRAAGLGVGLLLMVIGDLTPKTRFNYVMGIRVPWTLADERVWDRTHRFAGPWMMAGGALAALAALLAPVSAVGFAITVGALAPLAAAVVYAIAISPRSAAA